VPAQQPHMQGMKQPVRASSPPHLRQLGAPQRPPQKRKGLQPPARAGRWCRACAGALAEGELLAAAAAGWGRAEAAPCPRQGCSARGPSASRQGQAGRGRLAGAAQVLVAIGFAPSVKQSRVVAGRACWGRHTGLVGVFTKRCAAWVRQRRHRTSGPRSCCGQDGQLCRLPKQMHVPCLFSSPHINCISMVRWLLLHAPVKPVWRRRCCGVVANTSPGTALRLVRASIRDQRLPYANGPACAAISSEQIPAAIAGRQLSAAASVVRPAPCLCFAHHLQI
jgi:hypothetical protein